jgi:hypothetical protein
MAKKIHYGGTVIRVADSVQRDAVRSTVGAITLPTPSGGYVTLATGPGIAIALEESPIREADDIDPIVVL